MSAGIESTRSWAFKRSDPCPEDATGASYTCTIGLAIKLIEPNFPTIVRGHPYRWPYFQGLNHGVLPGFDSLRSAMARAFFSELTPENTDRCRIEVVVSAACYIRVRASSN